MCAVRTLSARCGEVTARNGGSSRENTSNAARRGAKAPMAARAHRDQSVAGPLAHRRAGRGGRVPGSPDIAPGPVAANAAGETPGGAAGEVAPRPRDESGAGGPGVRAVPRQPPGQRTPPRRPVWAQRSLFAEAGAPRATRSMVSPSAREPAVDPPGRRGVRTSGGRTPLAGTGALVLHRSVRPASIRAGPGPRPPAMTSADAPQSGAAGALWTPHPDGEGR